MASSKLQKLVPLISRERSPIAVLADRRSIDIGEQDIRVDDYINDKLQTAADLASVDSLIASVETQRTQLQAQVGDPMYLLPTFTLQSQNLPDPPPGHHHPAYSFTTARRCSVKAVRS